MNNIIKNSTGFSIEENDYIFEGFITDIEVISHEIISDEQVHVGTNKGVILLDLSFTIDSQVFEDINIFTEKLFSNDTKNTSNTEASN